MLNNEKVLCKIPPQVKNTDQQTERSMKFDNSCIWHGPKSSSILIRSTGLNHSLVWFYGISTIVVYLMSNPIYTYILNIYDLVWLGFMAYQPL